MTVGHKGIKSRRRITPAEQELIDASIAMRARVGSISGPGVNQAHGIYELWQRFSAAELAVRNEVKESRQ